MKFPTTIYRRRDLISIAILMAIDNSLAQSNASGIAFQWKVPGERLQQAREATKLSVNQIYGDESSVDHTKGLPALYVIAGIIMLPELAKALMDVYKDWKYGSMVIDSRSDSLVIYHDPQGRADTTIVKSRDGTVLLYENRNSFDATKWLQLLLTATPKIEK